MQFTLRYISRLRSRSPIVNLNQNISISTSLKIFSSFRGGMEELSDLAHIDVKANDPIVLFREWQQEAKTFSTGVPGILCLATVSSDGKASARNLVLRRLDDDGFVVMTDRRSKKVQDLIEVPSAAMCFLWVYKKDNGENVSRQVRVEGRVIELEKQDSQELYDKEPLYCKIRTHICKQDTKINWEELKASHDQLLQKVRRGEADLSMPDHVIGYKLVPSSIEFYHARDHLIGDRVLFYKDTTTGDWNHHHIAA